MKKINQFNNELFLKIFEREEGRNIDQLLPAYPLPGIEPPNPSDQKLNQQLSVHERMTNQLSHTNSQGQFSDEFDVLYSWKTTHGLMEYSVSQAVEYFSWRILVKSEFWRALKVLMSKQGIIGWGCIYDLMKKDKGTD